MPEQQRPEVWLTGKLPGIPGLLQPVAHALLQARNEVFALFQDFDESKLWLRPGGVASPAFHLQHMAGVLDRLFTYANGQPLSAAQLDALHSEGKENAGIQLDALLNAFETQVNLSIEALKHFEEKTLTEHRVVGRAQLPSTTIGLLVHAAEHTMRHTGQLLVTVKIIQSSSA